MVWRRRALLPLAIILLTVSQTVAATAPPSSPPGTFARSPIRLMLEDEPALSADEPMYFIAGGADDDDGDITARFQLSFKYRIFDPGGLLGRKLTQARNVYVAYTQTSLWNWSAESAPFDDTTYRPSLFWQDVTSGRSLLPEVWRLGYEHASNGQAEERSRSVDMLFLRPVWWTELGGRELVFAPKFIAYLDKSGDNRGIDEYYGHVEWRLRYGSESSWLIEARLRGVEKNKSNIELNLSYPIRAALFYRAGGFIYLQYLEGYGESLLNYDIKAKPTLRLGFAIVR